MVYLVGGAVRDRLLGRPVEERDFVVVGATPADLLSLGFRQVGKDFPVFLHPARTSASPWRTRPCASAVGALDVGAIAAAAPEPAHIPQRIRAAGIGAIREALEPAS